MKEVLGQSIDMERGTKKIEHCTGSEAQTPTHKVAYMPDMYMHLLRIINKTKTNRYAHS